MATVIKTLKDNATGDTILPRTRTSAVTMADGSTPLETKINAIDTSVTNNKATYDAHIDSVTPHGGIQHKNLLHNWDFRNPVNQRGLTSYTTDLVYTIDRWKKSLGTVSVVSGGITITDSLYQYIEYPTSLVGKTLTATIVIDNITYSGSCVINGTVGTTNTFINIASNLQAYLYIESADKFNFRFFNLGNTSRVISIAKLELGTVSTLANDPPADFGEQLAICQRYFQKGRISRLNVSVDSTTTLYAMIPTPVSMRTNAPTLVSCTVHDWMRFGNTQITSYTLSSYATTIDGTQANGGIGIVLTFSTALFTLYQVGYFASISYAFSADL